MQSNKIERKLALIVSLVVVLAGLPTTVGADTGELSVSVYEHNVRIPLPCRAWVSIGDKRFFNPTTKSGTPYAKDRSFSCDGYMRQAHTSPVYVTVDGKPIASKADAEYMIRWIDRLLQVADKPGRYSSDTERAEVRAIFQKARQEYESIARKAVEFWAD